MVWVFSQLYEIKVLDKFGIWKLLDFIEYLPQYYRGSPFLCIGDFSDFESCKYEN